MPMLAVSGIAWVALIGGAVVALAFAGALVALRSRRPGAEAKPDIPPGMRPGPSDEMLERRFIERFTGWNLLFVLFFAVWLPVYWLQEPERNVLEQVELTDRSIERGSRWFELTSEENPTGFACARCHGEEAEGGETVFQGNLYPVPALHNVCGRLTIEGPGQIRETIMEGREGTPMPSWSVRFAGPMNDQQIQDLINYLLTIQTIEDEEENLCLNPPTEGDESDTGEEDGAEETPTGGGDPAPEETATEDAAP